MNERRQFLKMVAAGPAGAALLPLFAQTGQCSVAEDVEQTAETLGRLPENIIYTKDHQGVWKGKSGSHLPKLEVERAGGKPSVPGLYLTGNGPLAEVLQYELKRAGGRFPV